MWNILDIQEKPRRELIKKMEEVREIPEKVVVLKREGKTRRKRRRRGMLRGDRNKTYLSVHAPQFTKCFHIYYLIWF